MTKKHDSLASPVVICSLMLAFMTVWGRLNFLNWMCNLVAQLTFQVLCLQVVLAVMLAVFKHWRVFAINALMLVVNLALVMPVYLEPVKPESNKQYKRLRILTMNVNYVNYDYAAMVTLIRAVDPDVIFVQELTNLGYSHLKEGLADYKTTLGSPRSDPFGIGLFVKEETADNRIITFGQTREPVAVATLIVGTQPVKLCSYHAFPPVHPWGFQQQLDALTGMEPLKPKGNESLILGGDFNSTTYVSSLTKRISTLDLKDSRQGHGLEPSWNSQPPVVVPFFQHPLELSHSLLGNFVLIPIDHIFVSKSLTVVNHKVGPYYGSDHYPVYADVLVPQ